MRFKAPARRSAEVSRSSATPSVSSIARSTGASKRERNGKPSGTTTEVSAGLTAAAQKASSNDSDEDRLVDELVLRAAKPAHLVGERRPACGRLGRNEQDLAVGPAPFRPLQARRHDVGHLVDTHLGVGIPFRGAFPIGAGHEPVRDPPRQTSRAAGVVRRDPLAQQGEEPRPGIGVIALDSLHRGNGGIEVRALRCPGLPLLGQARDLAPVVEPRRMHEQKLIDAGSRPEQVRGGARLRFRPTLLRRRDRVAAGRVVRESDIDAPPLPRPQRPASPRVVRRRRFEYL